MKLTRDEISGSGSASPLRRFEQGIRAEVTRTKYTATLRRILCDILEEVLEGDFEERAEQFVERGREDPKWVTDVLTNLSWKLRGRSELPRGHADYLNPTSFKMYFKPLRKLLEMNDITINWKRVYSTFPEKDNVLDTRGWTRDDIAAMLVHARDPLDRAVVLLLASSGMRLGGLDLTWGDLTPIYREGGRLTADPGGGGEVACVAVTVYAGSPEKYTAFMTPEAHGALMQYGRAWADTMLRQPRPKDPLFLSNKMRARRASEQAVTKRVHRMAAGAGLRDRSEKNGHRFETQLVHGFRKFWNKTCKEALSGDSLASLIRAEYMMGHVGLVPLDQSYKTSMLEMAAEYVKVVPDLTIDDAERLRLSTARMAESIQRMEGEKDAEIERLKGQVRDMEEKMSKIIERGDSRAYGMLNATLASKTGGVPADVLESLTAMMSQMGAAQNDEIRKMRAEYDAKIDGLARTIEWVANGESLGRGTPARA